MASDEAGRDLLPARPGSAERRPTGEGALEDCPFGTPHEASVCGVAPVLVPVISSKLYTYYHQVRPFRAAGLGRGLGVAPESLARHARILQKAGYRLLTATEAVASAEARVAALTFDDGYADNLEFALPVLESLGATGTIYVVAGEIGRAKPSWAKAAEPDTDRLLTGPELVQVRAAGWEIGSHCVTHVRLATLSEAAQREELHRSKAILEDVLNQPVTSLAYPYGEFSATTQRVAEEAGYRHAFTTAKRGGDGTAFALGRYSLGGYRWRSFRQILKLRFALLRRSWKR